MTGCTFAVKDHPYNNISLNSTFATVHKETMGELDYEARDSVTIIESSSIAQQQRAW
jgi:hypothetical protein